MPHRATVVAAILVLSACTGDRAVPAISGPAEPLASRGAAQPVTSVRGHAGLRRYFDPGPEPSFVQHMSITADLGADGGVSGNVHSLSISPSEGASSSWREDVICLVVEGNVAWMGTVVVHASPGSVVPVGRHYVYRLVDDGSQDLVQRGPNLTDCTLEPPVAPLVESMQGEIRITRRS